MIQLYTSYRWMLLPSHERDYRMWLWHHKNMVANKIRAWMEKRYGKDGNYGAEDDSGGWEEDERVDSGDAWDDVRSNLTLPLIRKAVVKGD